VASFSSPTPTLISTLTAGNASVTVTGGINSSFSLGTLAPPRAWALPPAGISLDWVDATGQSLWLSGPSFTSRVATSSSEILSMTLRIGDGSLVGFRSAAGECFVTISTALVNQMGGIFDCQNLASSDGKLIVSAQGTFAASR
jgi:hypothetical protein